MNIFFPCKRLSPSVRFLSFFLCCLLLGASPTLAPAAPVLNSANNHYYEAVAVNGGLTWESAKTAAAARTYAGFPGYLVTLTSAMENQFVLENCPSAIQGNWWIGGYQDRTSTGYSEPAGGWKWVTGEIFQFSNWQTNEPNNINWPKRTFRR